MLHFHTAGGFGCIVGRDGGRAQQEEALADFDQACAAFSQAMARITSGPADPALQRIIEDLGSPKPARRAAVRPERLAPRHRGSKRANG